MCELHFQPDDIRTTTSAHNPKTGEKITCRLERPQLVPGAVPSQLPNCPTYLSKPVTTQRSSPDEKSIDKENEHLAQALQASMSEYNEQCERDSCGSLDELTSKLSLDAKWTITIREQNLLISRIGHAESECPQIECAVTVDTSLMVNVFLRKIKLSKLKNRPLPFKLDGVSTLNTVLEDLSKHADLIGSSHGSTSEDNDESSDGQFILGLELVLTILLALKSSTNKFANVLWFMCEQIQRMIKRQASYSPDFLVFTSIFYNLSPHAYRYLRESGHCLLPSYSTIRRLTLNNAMSPSMEQSDNTFLFYIKQKFKSLVGADKNVVLLLDEIHLKPFFDYKCGNIVGAAYNSEQAASTAFVFMVNSVFSKFKDVVHVLPASKMIGETLHNLIKKTVVGLEMIGFSVIAVITDNNAINSKAMSFFAQPPALQTWYPHPVNSERPLFFLFDCVHILKCIRNNWLNLKNVGKCFRFPQFSFMDICSNVSDSDKSKASFQALRRLYDVESGNLLKFAYKLSFKALSPSNLERQKVFLVLQVFNVYVAQALLALGPVHHIQNYFNTSVFIKIISTWWSIVNVKTSMKGVRHNNEFENPLRQGDSDSKAFMKYFVAWLARWGSGCSSLTRETFTALSHSSQGLLEITQYCFEEFHAKYVLLGKFQTDCLEARFGSYRQLAGGVYNVTLRQVFECEKKIRLMSVLKLKMNGRDVTLTDFSYDWNDLDSYDCSSDIPIEFNESDFATIEDVLPVTAYLAGYCCHSISKKLQCDECREAMILEGGDETSLQNSYIKGITRGGLLYPNMDMIKIVQINHLVLEKLLGDESFLKSSCQRALVVNTTLQVILDENLDMVAREICSNGHTSLKVIRMAIWITTNSLLNNYSSTKNDELVDSSAKKRKIQTLMK